MGNPSRFQGSGLKVDSSELYIRANGRGIFDVSCLLIGNFLSSNSYLVVLRISRAQSLRTISQDSRRSCTLEKSSFASLRYSLSFVEILFLEILSLPLFPFTDRIPFMVFSNCFVSLSFLFAIHFLSRRIPRETSRSFDRANLNINMHAQSGIQSLYRFPFLFVSLAYNVHILHYPR